MIRREVISTAESFLKVLTDLRQNFGVEKERL
jgi:hypothetical protein